MYRKIVVLVCVLALGLSMECLAKSTPETPEKTFTWNRKEKLIITFTGKRFTTGFKEFTKEIQKIYGRRLNAWGTYSLLDYAKRKERIETIRSNHTIFTVRPESLYDLENLEAKYPDLLPIPTEKLKLYLKTYGYPLFYFSHDSSGKIRGVIIAKEVDTALAKLLTKKPIPLDTLLQYENRKLKKAEKKQPKPEPTSFAWNYEERLIITFTGRRFTAGFKEFAQEAQKIYGRGFNAWGRRSLLDCEKEKVEENVTRLDIIRGCHTIFTVRPEYFYDLEDLEAQYPDLLPTSTENLKSYLKSYGYPLLYFSSDYTGIIRGVIIAKAISPSLAKPLTEKSIPLDTPLRHENGELKKLEK